MRGADVHARDLDQSQDLLSRNLAADDHESRCRLRIALRPTDSRPQTR